MSHMSRFPVALLLGLFLFTSLQLRAQDSDSANQSPAAAQSSAYPENPPGVFIMDSGWQAIGAASPTKSRVKNGVAASLSYGAVPATMISDYAGVHAAVQIQTSQVEICICHVFSLPGTPVIVRLHPKKDFRELDGGRLPILGAKLEQAEKNDLISADVTQPESTVWLVRPSQPLPPGEYALMLGTQNIIIYPFTVLSSTPSSQPVATQKQ